MLCTQVVRLVFQLDEFVPDFDIFDGHAAKINNLRRCVPKIMTLFTTIRPPRTDYRMFNLIFTQFFQDEDGPYFRVIEFYPHKNKNYKQLPYFRGFLKPPTLPG